MALFSIAIAQLNWKIQTNRNLIDQQLNKKKLRIILRLYFSQLVRVLLRGGGRPIQQCDCSQIKYKKLL